MTPPHFALTPRVTALLVIGAVLLLSVATYQPGFFGDELFPNYVASTSNSLAETFLRINEYKARLVFNGVWALATWNQLPRAAFAALNSLAMIWAALLSYQISTRLLKAGSLLATLVALAVVISRFGLVFYYDYLSGTIGTLGLALFLTTAYVLCKSLINRDLNLIRGTTVIALSTATVLTYETYIAGLAALGACTFVTTAFQCRRTSAGGTAAITFATSVLMVVVPLLTFVAATRLMSTLSVMTGTAGQTIAVDYGTVKTFTQFFSNSFLGTNIGNDWFVGKLVSTTSFGWYLGVISSILVICLWIWALSSSRGRWDRQKLTCAAFALSVAFATLAISSLPGLSRADARWLFPLSALVPLLVLTLPVSLPRNLLLVSGLGISLVHLAAGNVQGIYNTRASVAAGDITRAMQSMSPVASRGLVYGLPDNELEWILGGDALQGNDVRSGQIFCRVSLRKLPCVDPKSALASNAASSYDFSLILSNDGSRNHVYLASDRLTRSLSLNDKHSAKSITVLGGKSNGWPDWRWTGDRATTGDSVIVTDLSAHATTLLDAEHLRGKAIGYEVASANGEAASFRMQVNWLNADNTLIAPQIEVVQLGGVKPETHMMLLLPPPDARMGEIYITTHTPDSAPVAFNEVFLASF